jgi:ribosomal protein L32
MAEPQCPTCHEKGMEHRLSMSRGQQLRESPWFYVVYYKACGHVDGVFAQDVFPRTPRASFSIPISLRSRT